MVLLDALSASPAFFVSAVLVLGLLVGSFLNVVIYRVPLMLEREWRAQCAELAQTPVSGSPAATAPAEAAPAASAPPFNLIVPRSTCPKCRAPITALQNIPVISYLCLRGRCANCRTAISPRYPLIEALTGILSALVAWKFGYGPEALAALVLTWFLIALAFIDVDTQLLPDSMTLPLVWLGLATSAFLPTSAQATLPVDLHDSVIGAMAGYLSLWSIYHLFKLLTGKEGMGYGDFKLLAAIGAFLGWRMLLPTVLGAATVGALVGIAMLGAKGLTLRDKARGVPIAFGPFLSAAGWVMLMWGRELLDGYLGLFGPHP